MRIVRVGRGAQGNLDGCYGVLLTEEDGYLTILILLDADRKPTCSVAYRVPMESVYACKNRDEMTHGEYPSALWDGNLQTVCNDIRSLIKDGERHRLIKKIYAE